MHCIDNHGHINILVHTNILQKFLLAHIFASQHYITTVQKQGCDIVGVNKVSTPSVKRVKLPKITETVPDKSAEIFRDNGPITFDNNDIDFDDCNRSEERRVGKECRL